MAKDFNRSHFIGNFVKEARERIRRVEHGLISLETSKGNLEILPEILREIHTIKGSANMLGLKNISALAHSIESVLGKEKEGERFLNPPAMNILYQSMDMLFRMVEVIGQGGKETIDPSDICSTLTAVISPEERDEKTIGGQVSLPTETTLMPTYQYPHISHLGTVRIDTNRIDRLSKISTELIYWIMHESERYQQMRNLLSPFIRELPGELWANYQKIVESCDEQEVLGNRLLHDLQEEVLSISLVSLAHAFEGLPRSVRDLSQELGKEVELIMGGGEIAVDQKIIDQIGAPLIHLIRNAIDHGIETPHQRKLLGKPSKGK
jgi:two-component system, chemotaxis family, sensor kinase CheA